MHSELEPGTSEGERMSQHQTVVDIVLAYEASVADVKRAHELLARAEERLDLALSNDKDMDRVHLRDRHGRRVSYDAEAAISQLRLEIWSHLVDHLEIRRFLSVRRAKELNDMLHDKTTEKFPDITVENVFAFARGFRSQVSDMLEEAVGEVFDWLRPPGSRYKTNTELEIGKRAILGYMVEWGWRGRNAKDEYGYCVDWGYGRERLLALENVFSALDGRGSISKTYHSRIVDAINQCPSSGRGETEYFRFKCFRNKNLHLEFKRLDLLDRFNKIAGGRRLRPAAE